MKKLRWAILLAAKCPKVIHKGKNILSGEAGSPGSVSSPPSAAAPNSSVASPPQTSPRDYMKHSPSAPVRPVRSSHSLEENSPRRIHSATTPLSRPGGRSVSMPLLVIHAHAPLMLNFQHVLTCKLRTERKCTRHAHTEKSGIKTPRRYLHDCYRLHRSIQNTYAHLHVDLYHLLLLNDVFAVNRVQTGRAFPVGNWVEVG